MDLLLFQEREVGCEGPGVLGKILFRTKLERIDVNGNDDDLVLLSGDTNQSEMAFVQSAHGRNEPNGLPRPVPFTNLGLDKLGVGDDFHGFDQLFGGNLPNFTSSAYCLMAFRMLSWS